MLYILYKAPIFYHFKKNKKDDGGVEIQQVKITDSQDVTLLKEGLNVKIPVKVSSYQNKMFFTQVEPLLK